MSDDRRVEAWGVDADEPEPKAGGATTPAPRPWRTRLADGERAASERQQRQDKRKRGASSDLPRPPLGVNVLAPFSGFWYSRARVKLKNQDVGTSPIRTNPSQPRAPIHGEGPDCRRSQPSPRLKSRIGVLTPFRELVASHSQLDRLGRGDHPRERVGFANSRAAFVEGTGRPR